MTRQQYVKKLHGWTLAIVAVILFAITVAGPHPDPPRHHWTCVQGC